ncbi:hypothetical protein [Nocardioides sp. HB32]
MATGPQRARLDRALHGANDGDIDRHASEWEYCQGILQQIGTALLTASPEVKQKIGGRTGPAVDAAFNRSATSMSDKSTELGAGAQALRNAADVIRSAKIEQDDLARHPLSEPPPYHAPVGPPTRADIQAESQNRQAHSNYQAAYDDQEARAKKQADAMDRVFGHSATTMKQIHGEPDPKPAGSSGGGTGGASGGGASGGSGGSVTAGGGGGPRSVDGPTYYPGSPGTGTTGTTGHPGSPVPGPGYVPAGGGPGGAPQGGGPVGPISTPAAGGTPGGTPGATGGTSGGSIGAGTGLGLAGAAAGGAAGGLLGTGLSAGGLRGGAVSPVVTSSGTAASGVRGIGATSRTGVTGPLGRPGGAGAVSSGSGSGRSGAASAAGRRGTTGGSRGAAGGRGTGAASGRGGRGGKDDKRRKRDVFDTGDEWVEDEDAAPGVLD